MRDGTACRRTIDNSPVYARRACEASLERLGIERIDLYYAHRVERSRIGSVPCSPLGRGFLAGAFDDAPPSSEGDFRSGLPRFSADALDTNRSLTATVRSLAADDRTASDRRGALRNLAGAPTVHAVSDFVVELFDARRGRLSGMECSPNDV